MQIIENLQVKEKLYTEKLENGLNIMIIPKKGIKKKYVMWATHYGSMDNKFVVPGEDKETEVPDGVAHFLEHKMFEQEDGTDIFSFYSERGADCNANTNYTKTSYLFSSPNFLEENLNMLLDYVQKPYFTDDNVEKEKGIITQEIKMYQDMPGTVIYDKILENTFNVNPMQYPIIGTIESINSITKDDLYTCYNTFYHPANMFIVIVGNVEANEVIDIVKTNQDKKHFEDFTPIKIKKYDEPKQVKKTDETIKLNVTIPKCAIAYKIKINKNIKDLFYLLALFDCKFSSTSDFVSDLFDEEIINDNLTIDFDNSTDYTIMFVLGETTKPDVLLNRIKKEMENLTISEEEFNRKKKVLLSSSIYMSENIFSLNNDIVNDLIKYGKFNNDKYNDIKSLNYKDFCKLIKNIDFSNYTTLIIEPKSK